MHSEADAVAVVISLRLRISLSEIPPLTNAGFYNTRFRDGYLPIAYMLARHDAVLNFICIEMRDHEQSKHDLCPPKKLLGRLPVQPGKPRYPGGEDREMCAFTYLRMNPKLFQPDNWRSFVTFVKKMKGEGSAQ
ncbi:hypothetical protein MLD38_027220 [Melastoma candidum]|uniref:Uncharacterized protein n=1 Tax=Melastoma candidum TaxID=119954 RepID=A0ACB9P0X0_9MYRT|nr:hypothetical protein MLD38_027220 [Melastoma candidum]